MAEAPFLAVALISEGSCFSISRTFARSPFFIESIYTRVNTSRTPMKKVRINLVGSGNLAFVIVVAAAYLSATSALIYSRRSLSALEIGVLIAAGLAYLVVGTYGFTIARQSGT